MAELHTVQRSAQGGFDILDADGNVVAHDSSMVRAVEVAYEIDQDQKPISATPAPAGVS